MNTPIRLAVAGAGLVGKRHVTAIARSKQVELISIIDPDASKISYAQSLGVNWYASLTDMFLNENPDGVILATPNNMHVENGLECVRNFCPILVEKPLATTAMEAMALVDTAKKADVSLLVGHHRRHNPLIQKAKEIIDQGKLGQLRAVHANCWLYKPDEYFEEAEWRKASGAGPISVNLVHDIDLVRYLCGDVISVHAQAANSLRGFENEDVAAAILGFKNGSIGTITVSDMIVSPWSWELTARENPVYPPTNQSCYLIGGTQGSLSLPDLTFWSNENKPGWWEPINATSHSRDYSDPLINQISQFAAVISGTEAPLVSGEEGLKTLQVIESIQNSARSGETIFL